MTDTLAMQAALEAATKAVAEYTGQRLPPAGNVLTCQGIAEAAITAFLNAIEAEAVMVPVNDVRRAMAWIGDSPAEMELYDRLERLIAARPRTVAETGGMG